MTDNMMARAKFGYIGNRATLNSYPASNALISAYSLLLYQQRKYTLVVIE